MPGLVDTARRAGRVHMAVVAAWTAACAAGPSRPGARGGVEGAGDAAGADEGVAADARAGAQPGGDAPPPGGGRVDVAAATDAAERADRPAARDVAAASDAVGAEVAPGPCAALLCEGFEAGPPLDAARWKARTSSAANTLRVEPDRVAHGRYALHAHLQNTGGGEATVRETQTFPALGSELWGRLSFYSTAGNLGHTGFISAYVDGKRVLEIAQSGATWQLTYYPPTGERPIGTNASVPQNRWACLEWTFSHTSKIIQLFVDGQPAATYTLAVGATIAGPFTELGLGMDDHGAQPGQLDVYFDDVAVDAKRIGCVP